jgi:hypothetical protein
MELLLVRSQDAGQTFNFDNARLLYAATAPAAARHHPSNNYVREAIADAGSHGNGDADLSQRFYYWSLI